jgi:hypothetical protein
MAAAFPGTTVTHVNSSAGAAAVPLPTPAIEALGRVRPAPGASFFVRVLQGAFPLPGPVSLCSLSFLTSGLCYVLRCCARPRPCLGGARADGARLGATLCCAGRCGGRRGPSPLPRGWLCRRQVARALWHGAVACHDSCRADGVCSMPGHCGVAPATGSGSVTMSVGANGRTLAGTAWGALAMMVSSIAHCLPFRLCLEAQALCSGGPTASWAHSAGGGRGMQALTGRCALKSYLQLRFETLLATIAIPTDGRLKRIFKFDFVTLDSLLLQTYPRSPHVSLLSSSLVCFLPQPLPSPSLFPPPASFIAILSPAHTEVSAT